MSKLSSCLENGSGASGTTVTIKEKDNIILDLLPGNVLDTRQPYYSIVQPKGPLTLQHETPLQATDSLHGQSGILVPTFFL